MDTTTDILSFDLQSTYVSFQERRWLFEQRAIYKLDKLLNPIANLQKTIRGYQQFSKQLGILSSLSIIPEVSLTDQYLMYYQSDGDGVTNNQIDQFRLHYQQKFQFIFSDLCQNIYYRILIITIEGFVFYASQTAKEYRSLIQHEMSRCLSSFYSFIQSRESKVRIMLSSLINLSLSSYQMVSRHQYKGILFQLLPKIRYAITSTTEYNSIMALDKFKDHTISPEELRWIDYSMNMKNKHILVPANQRRNFPTNGSAFRIGTMQVNFPILHSLPIIYPYDEHTVYSQKYPLFWKGNNYKNEKSNVLFETISIEKTSPEYLFVHRLFHQTIPEKDTMIAIVERVENPHLWEKFSAHRSYMRRKNGPQNLNETWLFHGTKSDNHHQIMAHGFNRSYCQDYVLFGRGVYFSRFAGYSYNYSDRKDLSFLFLCRVLVGYFTPGRNDIRVPPNIKTSDGKSIQADSTTDGKNPYDIVCTFHDDQNYPEYIITFMDQPNKS